MTDFRCVNREWFDCDGVKIPEFPLQVGNLYRTVPLPVAEEAYIEYVARWGNTQNLARIGERGGFGGPEIAILLYQRCQKLQEYIKLLKDNVRLTAGDDCLKCGHPLEFQGREEAGVYCPACDFRFDPHEEDI